jgi:Flp pilus assembly protein TadD
MMGEMNRNKVEAGKADTFYALNAHGEDWEGFRKAMEASSLPDKDLVLRVLTMYPDVEQREKEIKNMAATYTEIAEDILPKLRRSEMTMTFDHVGYSDEELTTMSKTMPDSLNVEELLYAANLTGDQNEKLRIYKETERVHPTDYRASNNIGCIYYEQNKLADAEAQFQKANSIKDNPISNNNLGACARLKGDRKKAMGLYKKAAGAGPEVNYNMGIIDIQNGDYASANSHMSGVNDFNAALAKLLGGDAAGAQRILEASPDKDTAQGHYLMAIIGARQNNGDMVKTQLGMAVAQDASLGDKAKKDLEFRAFKDNLGI